MHVFSLNIYFLLENIYITCILKYRSNGILPRKPTEVLFKDFSETSTKSKCLRKYRLKRFVQVRGSFGKYVA